MIDVIYQQNVPVPHTGDVIEFPLGSAIIPPGILGAMGSLRINFAYSHDNSINNKTFRAYFGGVLVYSDVENTNSTSQAYTMRIRNQNSLAAQLVSSNSEWTPALFNPDAGINVDTALSQVFLFTGQLANAGGNLSLDSMTIEILRVG
jgi:hypothetical protein